jgi:hypothetical protein
MTNKRKLHLRGNSSSGDVCAQAMRAPLKEFVSKQVKIVTLPVFCRKRAEDGVAECSGLYGCFDG